MCPGKLGKCPSSHPGMGQEQCFALLRRQSGHAQAQGAAGKMDECNRGAALSLTAGTKTKLEPEVRKHLFPSHKHLFVTFPPNLSSSKRMKLQILAVCIYREKRR